LTRIDCEAELTPGMLAEAASAAEPAMNSRLEIILSFSNKIRFTNEVAIEEVAKKSMGRGERPTAAKAGFESWLHTAQLEGP
jgi:hypothetical protein